MITLERRPFKQIEYVAAEGVTRPEAIRGNPNSFEKLPNKRPFKKLEHVCDERRDGLFAISIQQYLYVRDPYGKLKWSADVSRYTNGDFQQVQGLCFGLDHDVWIGWIDFFYQSPTYPLGHRDGYLFHYDRNGNFLEERPAQLYGDGLARSLVCSPRGMILLTQLDETVRAGGTLDDVSFEFTSQPTGLRSVLAFDDEDNVYATAQTNATGAAFWKWASDGTLLSIIPSSYALGGCAVAGDGTFAWSASQSTEGANWITEFYKVDLSDGSLISSFQVTTPDPVRSMRLTPWGDLLYAMNDIDASEVDGQKLVAQGLFRNPFTMEGYISGSFVHEGEEIWVGDLYSTQVNAVATSVN